jgi:hypothetical protein
MLGRVSPGSTEDAERVADEAQGLREAAGRFFPGGHRLLDPALGITRNT